VRGCDVPVLALEESRSDARCRIEAEIERGLEEDSAEAIVLGCAGMTDLAHDLAKKAGVLALDGVACTVSLAESLVRIGLTTSKRNSYAPPLAKPYAGEINSFAPH
jgi:allantoin racemase